MDYTLAPLEGLTGNAFRSAHKKCFDSLDRYMAPFISANQHGKLRDRDIEELLPENNEGMVVIPQIMTNDADCFINTAKTLVKMGYREVNMNLGCPFHALASKGKGSGFLGKPEELDIFLNRIYAETPIRISLKTRLGISQPEEFLRILSVYKKYPVEELILHPRVREDFYDNKPNLDAFERALEDWGKPITYNGDLFTVKNMEAIHRRYPAVESMMLGRGVLVNPGIITEFQTGEELTKEKLNEFYGQLLENYCRQFDRDLPILNALKGLWMYTGVLFEDSEEWLLRIRRTKSVKDYEAEVLALIKQGTLRRDYSEHLSFRAPEGRRR